MDDRAAHFKNDDLEEMRLALRKDPTLCNKIPATSAHLGPAFDSCAIALSALINNATF